MEIIPAQYELSSMINDLVNMVRDRAEKKGLGLTVNVDVNIPHVLYGDEIRIKQCALNILTNAVKYTEKGNVELNLGYEQCDDENIMLDFSIKDTGIGMKKDDIEQLFSPFSRIEEKRNRGIEGTGLGMSITKRLLALMDSSLKVVSVYGEGSEFSFSVKQKVIKAEAIGDYSVRYRSESKRAEYQAMFRAPAARVLVVDDTPVNLSVIRGLLKKTLVRIETAESGREALKMAEKSDYDIVFIDHMMPEMDGIETLKKLREIKGYSDTYCVALTANAVSGAREMYIQEGFSDYLSKPVEGEMLEKMLMEYLPSEKIIKVDGIETEKPANILERLGGIEGIDPEKGLKNCGDEDSYIEVLSVYVKTAAQTADDIEKYVGAGDIENAAVKIHAVKSTARVIGADSMGKSAAKLEAACKSNNTEMLNAGIGDLLSSYRALGSALAEIFTVSETDVQ